MLFARDDLHVDHDAGMVIHGRMLPVAGPQRGPGRRRHGRVRIGPAEPPAFAAAAGHPLGVIGLIHRVEVAGDQFIHADIGADQTGVDVDGFSRDQSRRLALLHDTGEYPAEHALASTLPDAGQGGMIRQGLVQRVADEPADRQIDLRLAYQPSILNDPGKEASQHQAHSNLGIDTGASIVRATEAPHLGAKPPRIRNPVNPHQHMLVGIRSRNEPVMNNSSCPRSFRPGIAASHSPISSVNQIHMAFSTAPGTVF